jgi:hypothetical protein
LQRAFQPSAFRENTTVCAKGTVKVRPSPADAVDPPSAEQREIGGEGRVSSCAFLRAALTLLYNRLTKQDTAPAPSVM